MIIPALLTTNERIAEERITLAKSMSGWLHLDVLDETLYDFRSLPIKAFERFDFGGLLLECHCMTKNPEALLQTELPIQRLILHYEIPRWQAAYAKVIRQGFDCWIAIAPETKIKTLDLPKDVSGLVLMGVEPGQTGQEFMPETYERMEALKDYFPDVTLTVDGGVSAQNLRLLLAHGADNLIAGSAIFQSSSPQAAYEKLVQLSDPIGGAYDH